MYQMVEKELEQRPDDEVLQEAFRSVKREKEIYIFNQPEGTPLDRDYF
jgi:hypothetical protein